MPSNRFSSGTFKAIFFLAAISLFVIPALMANAQEGRDVAAPGDVHGIWRAKVIEIVETKKFTVPGTDVESETQTVKAVLLEGERKDQEITFENDYIQLGEDDIFYLNYVISDGGTQYSVFEIDRRVPLIWIVILFVAVILFFGGKQGFRSLLSLLGSLLVIAYLLVPALVKGFPPVPSSVALAGAILFFAIFFTHGFNKRSLVAFLGTIIAVAITGLLAYVSIEWVGFTGFANDESIYLNLNTGGRLDLAGLLLAGIIIGALGVLDDIAVTQVAVVRELFSADKSLRPMEIYKRAIRVGREHVGALVNTLVLAYTGSALPLLLLFYVSNTDAVSIVNREIFATEVVRSLIGSIGLVLAVPITTYLAVVILKNENGANDDGQAGHAHSH